jgi:ComF family protein
LRYNASSRRLILPFKHGDRSEFAFVLAAHMAHVGATLLRGADALVPVPLHRRRLFLRRYNQAGLLATSLSRLTGIPAVLDVLVRCQSTASLDNKSATERVVAVRDAFLVRSSCMEVVLNGRLVLIDDVLTSGATVNSCTRSLLAAGVRSVDVLSACRVPDPRLDLSA